MSNSSWIDQGCWNDKKTNPRIIPNQAPGAVKYNFDTCRNYAEQEGADTFGLQFGGNCFYGNNIVYEESGKASQCPMLGGSYTNHVYTQAETPTTWDDRGCWIDNATRLIKNAAPGGGVYSVGSCKAYALSEGADTIGLQFPTATGSSCFYGNSPNYTALGESKGVCNPAGGGNWVNHVYTIAEQEQVPNSNNGGNNDPDKKKKKTEMIVGIVIGVVVLLVIIALIVYATRRNSTPSQNTYEQTA